MFEQTGRSTKQILEAKQDAVYVCRTASHCSYLKQLTRQLNRSDIHVVTVYWLTEKRYMGLELSEIILDHSVKLNAEEYEYLLAALPYLNRK